MARYDSYAKLRPPEPTPVGETCRCTDAPIKLMSALGYNPLHCMNCNLEVSPDTLTLPAAVIDAIADWATIYNAIDRLWLDSGSYEGWAGGQLADIASPVNTRGRNVQAVVDGSRRCYYWSFQDESVTNYQPIRECPVCGDLLRDYTLGVLLQRICERDSIVASG